MSDQKTFSVPEEEHALPFDAGQQEALLGHILTSQRFYTQVADKLQAEWFADSSVGKVLKFYKSFFKEFHRLPNSLEEFKTYHLFLAMDQKDRNAIYILIGRCIERGKIYGMDHLTTQLNTWYKAQVFFRDLPQIANLINSRKVVDAEQLVLEMNKRLSLANIEADKAVDIVDWRSVRAMSVNNVQAALTTGLRLLDRRLLEESLYGGLIPGDSTIVLAPSNVGKTTFLMNMARLNAMQGKSVLWITREGNHYDLVQKLYQSAFDKTRHELWSWSQTKEGEAALDQYAIAISKFLTYLHLPSVCVYVEDVIAQILRLQEQRRTQGKSPFHMVVVDYPGIFQTREASGAKWEVRHIQDLIYRSFIQLAAQENFHLIAAAQTNREASKINKGINSFRLLVGEDVGETWGIYMAATNVLTLNRGPSATAQNYLTVNLVKSRSSETGWAVTAKSKFSSCISHSDELGGVAYRSDVGEVETVEHLLASLNTTDHAPVGFVVQPPKNRVPNANPTPQVPGSPQDPGTKTS